MASSLQWIVLVLRGGINHKEYGDPYSVHVTVLNCGEYAQVTGLSGDMSRDDWRDALEKMADFGITRLREYRKKSGWWEYDLTVKPFKRKKI